MRFQYRVIAGVAILPVVMAAAQQVPPDVRYLTLVSRYAGGSHVAAVVEAVTWRPEDITELALGMVKRRAQVYEDGLGVTRGRPALGAADYLAWLRAASALHLEAAISAPLDRYSARVAHMQVAETALQQLDATRQVAWKRDPTAGPTARSINSRFRRDWHLVAATHFQRIGAFADALTFTSRAIRAFPDEAVFHVIAGSVFEALGSATAADDVSAVGGLPGDPGERKREALQRATRAFEQALVLSPNDPEARIRIARVHLLLGRLDLARRYLVDDAPPGRLAYLLALVRGHAAEADTRHDDAVDHYRQAVGMSDRWQSACVALSHALSQLGHLEEARLTVRECVSRESSARDPWSAYGMGLEWLVEPTVRQMRARVSSGPAPAHD